MLVIDDTVARKGFYYYYATTGSEMTPPSLTPYYVYGVYVVDPSSRNPAVG